VPNLGTIITVGIVSILLSIVSLYTRDIKKKESLNFVS